MDMPMMVTWPGDWKSFLDLAAIVQARILYLVSARYDVEVEIHDAMPEAGHTETNGDEGTDEHKEQWEWLCERVKERTSEWDRYAGQIAYLFAYWFRDGVAHCFHATTSWYDEVRAAIKASVKDAYSVSREDRNTESPEEAQRLFECAKQMAQHERFVEATNEDKRRFMAKQLFPEEERPFSEWAWKKIAEWAILYHWWYIEPTEQVSVVEKVLALYDQGETIKSISAVLHVTQKEVKKIITTAGND